MRRDHGKLEFFDDCLSFVSTGVYGREGGIRGRKEACVAIDRRTGGKLRSPYIYSCLYR